MFSILTNHQKQALINNLVQKEYADGNVIVRQGDTGDHLYLIKDGEVIVYVNDKEVRRMQTGEFFGEQALLYDCPRTATIVATGPV